MRPVGSTQGLKKIWHMRPYRHSCGNKPENYPDLIWHKKPPAAYTSNTSKCTASPAELNTPYLIETFMILNFFDRARCFVLPCAKYYGITSGSHR
jgi:hypothetical protein